MILQIAMKCKKIMSRFKSIKESINKELKVHKLISKPIKMPQGSV